MNPFINKFLLVVFIIISILTGPGFPKKNNSEISLVGNAHIDIAYRWRLNETVDRVIPDTFLGVLRMMDQIPDLTFAQSQIEIYSIIHKEYPQLFDEIQQQIKNKRWSVVGGQWVEPDAILPSGESLIRQFLIGSEFTKKYLGIESTDIAWVPDSFCGQALTLPMIYSGCGIKYYVFGRGAPANKRVFWWKSPDGSRVLAYKIPHHYNVKINPNLEEIVSNWSNSSGIKNTMVLFGEGDHGGGPRQPDIDAVDRLKSVRDFPKIKYTTPQNYFKSTNLINQNDIDTYEGELGIVDTGQVSFSSQWRGSYVSQARVKKANRDMENLFLTAETFATIGTMLQKKPLFPRVDFRESWKLILQNQFHDILPGTSIGDVFDDAMKDYQYLKFEGDRLLNYGLEIIGSRIDTQGEGIPLVVYNSLSWKRSGIVQTKVRFNQPFQSFAIIDPAGKEIVYQVNNVSSDSLYADILFLAENVPSVGYKVFKLIENRKSFIATDLNYGPGFFVNKFYVINWDSIGITSIYDIYNNKEILSGTGNQLKLFTEINSNSWSINVSNECSEQLIIDRGPDSVKTGPVSCSLFWYDKTKSSKITRELILQAASTRIEFKMTVDWHDHDKLLQVSFPTCIDSGTIVFEQPYGTIQRNADGLVWPAQNWIDFSNHKIGLTLINNGKYGFDVLDNTINMSVVHGPRDMDPRMDEGVHSFGYALYSHAGDWKEANVIQESLEFNRPLIVKQENPHSGEMPAKWPPLATPSSLPLEHSFFEIENDHAIISAIKVQQGDWSPNNVVLRIFETEGREETITVDLPAKPKKVIETNHIEKTIPFKTLVLINDNSFSFIIRKHELRTFLIVF